MQTISAKIGPILEVFEWHNLFSWFPLTSSFNVVFQFSPFHGTFQIQIFILVLKAKSICKGKYSPGANYFLDRRYHNVVQTA